MFIRALSSAGAGIRKTAVFLIPGFPALLILGKLHGLPWWQAIASSAVACAAIVIVAGITYSAGSWLTQTRRWQRSEPDDGAEDEQHPGQAGPADPLTEEHRGRDRRRHRL